MATSNVEQDLLAEAVNRLDLNNFCIVTGDTSVRDTVEQMTTLRQQCALVVGEGTQLIGLFTDRDVLKRVVSNPEVWDDPIRDHMTPSPQTVPTTASTQAAMRLMDEHRFRNVPVVNARGAPVGNVTHYAILRFLSDHYPEAIYNLPPNPSKYSEQRDGG